MHSNQATLQRELFSAADDFQRPFLKWAGGKFRVLKEVLPRLPSGERLVEPFAGSAAVSLNARFAKALVADTNSDLIGLYQAIKTDLSRFIAEGRSLFAPEFNSREMFNALRDEFNSSDDGFRRAVIFVYLNRHAFNGLCRYNSKGQFNVPFGRYKGPAFPQEAIQAFSEASKRIDFRHQDFATTLNQANQGDVIYCDPPYVPLSDTSNFTSYTPGSFGPAEQEELSRLARETAARGIPVVISNHDTAESRDLYQGAELYQFQVRRFISSKASTRGDAPELLAIFR